MMLFGCVEVISLPEGWEVRENLWLELRRYGCLITIEKRPHYCDRGNWIAKITDPGKFWIDQQDGWPRYYFDLKVAFSEIDAFLTKRQAQSEE